MTLPPTAATRMLHRAGIDPAIIGDLAEEYSRGRSRLWFWMQAFGALITKSPEWPQAFRWLAVVPMTILAVVIEFVVAVQARSFLALIGAAFVMSLTAVKVSVFVAPSRKHAVRRIALCVVTICGGLGAVMNQLLGFSFVPVLFWIGASAVLGAAAEYFSAAHPKTLLWKEIDLGWLAGLTRPPRGEH